MSSSRENILESVRKATQISSHMPDEQTQGLDERIQASLKSITPSNSKDLREQFKKELETVAGEFHVVKNENEMVQLIVEVLQKNDYKSLAVSGPGLCMEIASKVGKQVSDTDIVNASTLDYTERRTKLAETNAALVEAVYAVADTGSLVILPDETPSMLPHFLPDCIFAVIQPDQLIPNMFELLKMVPNEKAKNMLMVTGPSRTADVEKILILGAHGPRFLIVGMIEK